ncbi:MAG: hypothetical protein ABI747_03975 [Candidatus Moraniibacteriota bacterium]
MPLSSLTLFLRGKIGTLFLAGLFFGAASFFVLTVTEKRFQTTTDFMVVQTGTQNQDFYTLFKSSEYLGKILSESLYSERFIGAVVETGKVSKEFLPFDKKDRLDTWRKMISVKKNIELGMLSVSVKSDSEREAGRIMEAVQNVLIEKNALFRGGDEKSVEIRILSGPITERNPNASEIVLVVALGFLVGVLLTAIVSVLKSGLFRPRASLSIPSDLYSQNT